MTKLEAVNIILRANGQAGVNALDTNGNSDAAQAERILDRWELKIQSRGWHYNTRVNVETDPDDTTSQIPVPDSVITIDTERSSLRVDVTPIGRFLYDREENTFEFDSSVILTYVVRYEFDCIPQPVAEYIADAAAAEFNRHQGQSHRWRQGDLELETRKSKAAAFRFDGDSSDANILETEESLKIKGWRSGGWRL